jgi:ABC-type spermidine/putrescine transport system permease subunit I|tara:strand:- start:2919 stop:3827 length:909 start_codon:yes stop_codon:yes gene_type:complete
MGGIDMTTSTLVHVNEKELKTYASKERRALLGLTSPALLVILIVMVIPVGWLFYLSFIGSDGNFSLEHYQRMLDSKSYARIFLTTFKVSLLTTAICILIGYPLAYFLSQLPARVANICMLSVLLPFWTSLLVRTYSWLVLLQRKGIVNQVGMDFGFWDEPLKLVHNLSGTLVGMVHIMLPFLILPLYASMKSIPQEYIKASSNLGATPTQSFWQIFFPLSMPGLLAGSLIVFILSLGFFVTPAVLGGGKVIMVAMQITNNIELFFDWGAASALGVVLLVMTFVILFVASKLMRLDNVLGGGH